MRLFKPSSVKITIEAQGQSPQALQSTQSSLDAAFGFVKSLFAEQEEANAESAKSPQVRVGQPAKRAKVGCGGCTGRRKGA